jgi:hypothetical protein
MGYDEKVVQERVILFSVRKIRVQWRKRVPCAIKYIRKKHVERVCISIHDDDTDMYQLLVVVWMTFLTAEGYAPLSGLIVTPRR